MPGSVRCAARFLLGSEVMRMRGMGFERRARRGRATAARALAAFVGLLPLGCDYASWSDRWLFDGPTGHSSAPASGGEVGPLPACEAAPIEGYGYAEAPEFWLGTQAGYELRVDGPGYLVAGTGDVAGLRYLRVGELAIAPDGSLELGGAPAIGYPLNVTGGDACLGQLRAPSFAPARASSRIEIGMNVDPRSPVVTFDVLDPSGSSNASVSMLVFDSAGVSHYLDIYFSNLGGMTYEYHVVVDGGDLVGGTPGDFVLVSTGRLRFGASGALASAATPPVAIAFAGGVAPGQIELGYEGSTSFASGFTVFSLAVDGVTEGIGSGLDVSPGGEVVVFYDNGEALSLGSLALARFQREAALAAVGEGWGMTPESGAPQLGTPQSPGRGLLVVGSVSAWP